MNYGWLLTLSDNLIGNIYVKRLANCTVKRFLYFCVTNKKPMNILFSPFTLPEFNLAAEEHLFLKTGEDFLLLYVNKPSVIIGSNQAVMNEVDMDFCIENGIRIFRRISGGGAVYHDKGNLNYCFIRNRTDAPLSAEFLKPIVEVLNEVGVSARIGKRKDIWLEGYKISGTASHISGNREMHHGTLLYDSDLEKLRRSLTPEFGNPVKKATVSVPSPVKNIRDHTEEVLPADQFFQLFIRKLLGYYKLEDLSTFSDADVQYIETIKKEKYVRREWNYRM